jgi:hypothetical protein
MAKVSAIMINDGASGSVLPTTDERSCLIKYTKIMVFRAPAGPEMLRSRWAAVLSLWLRVKEEHPACL